MTDTSCQRLQALISEHPEQAEHLPEPLQKHSEGCAACQVELRAATRLLAMLEGVAADLIPEASPAEVAARAMESGAGDAKGAGKAAGAGRTAGAGNKTATGRSDAAPRRAASRLWLWFPATAVAAAAATLLVVFGMGWLGGGAKGPKAPAATPEDARLTARTRVV